MSKSTTPRLLIVMGVSGCGKSTIAHDRWPWLQHFSESISAMEGPAITKAIISAINEKTTTSIHH